MLSLFALCALLPLIPFAAIVIFIALCLPHYAALFIASTVGTGATMAAIAAYYRGKIREKYLIEGSFWSDFLIHFWCGCCAIAQEARHVDTDYGLIVSSFGIINSHLIRNTVCEMEFFICCGHVCDCMTNTIFQARSVPNNAQLRQPTQV